MGGAAGLVVGLATYAPTAWFAVFEAGILAGAVGGVLGGFVALVVNATRRASRGGTASR